LFEFYVQVEKLGKGWLNNKPSKSTPSMESEESDGWSFNHNCATYERNSLADNRQSVLQPFQSFAHYRSCARLIIFLQDKISASNADLTWD